MRINKNTYNTFIAFLIGLYFMFTSLDYLLKISSGASYLRVAGISIYVFALLGIVIFGGFKANKYQQNISRETLDKCPVERDVFCDIYSYELYVRETI